MLQMQPRYEYVQANRSRASLCAEKKEIRSQGGLIRLPTSLIVCPETMVEVMIP